jgi:hypothetical protein
VSSGRKTIDIRALHCPQCGAPAQVHPGENVYVCNFCQASFLVERAMADPPPIPAIQPPVVPPANPYAARDFSRPQVPVRIVDYGAGRRSGGGGAVGAIITLAILIGVAAAILPLILRGGSGGGIFGGGWSGKEPLVCSGNEWIVVDHVKAHFDKGVAIDASGNCEVSCKDCDISAPTIVRARENASVHFDHGTAEGKVFYEASENASVSNDHTKAGGTKKDAPHDYASKPEWPSSGPFVCGEANGGGEFKNVKVKVTSGAAIVASVNCSLKLSDCTIEGPVGILLNDNANIELDNCEVHATVGAYARANGEIQLEGGTFVGTDKAVDLKDNASLHGHGAKVEGSKSTEGNAEVELE